MSYKQACRDGAAIRFCFIAILSATCGCRTQSTQPSGITVAAAANLTDSFDEIGRAFTQRTGVPVVLSYGATAQLARQIEHGAPFDVFASADTAHVDELLRKGKLIPGTRAIYARGRLVLWAPKSQAIQKMADLTDPSVRYVAIAKPSVAPYGEAAVEALKASGLWAKIQPKVVYANSISMAKQLAASGNADAAFTAYSLVFKEAGAILEIDERLHKPIDQAVGIPASSEQKEHARRFAAFVLGTEGRRILARYRYKLP